MRPGIVCSLAMVMLSATAAVGQHAPPRGAPPPPRPPKCAYHHRLQLVGDCGSKRPWRCAPCPGGIQILGRSDKCGAPVEVCATP